MSGDTYMGLQGPTLPKVTADYRSWYLLGSVPFGRHRVSVRYEEFRVWDRDIFAAPDGADETGKAWTFAYLLRVLDQHRLAMELLRIDGSRPARASIGDTIEAEELLFQMSFRLLF